MSRDLNERWVAMQQRTPQFKVYYWVLATVRGKRVLLGPSNTEAEASDVGFRKTGVQFEVIALNTRDRAAATQQVKAKLLKETSDVETTLRRIKHKV